jgi:integrase
MRSEFGLSEKTIKNVLYDLGQFFRWLSKQGDIPETPPLPSRELKLVEYQPKVPEADVVARVLSEIPEEKRGIFLVRCRMGLRPTEARRLNVVDLARGKESDLVDAHIAIPPKSSKKKRGRRLQLHPKVAAWLVKHGELNRFGAEPLFKNQKA